MIRVLFLAACFALGMFTVVPPPLKDPASPAEFDHRAAWTTVQELAHEPHAIGTPAHDRARDVVLARLTALGLAPQVQAAVGQNGHATTVGLVQNIVARLDPPHAVPKAGDAILLVTHYDSRIAAPGAGDDGAAVAALIDVMRALKSGPPLARPVIFLCTDGEEQGLLGAEAFVSQHPWAREVGVVLNFEARGTRGPALLFETSENAGGLVRVAEEVTGEIVGTSLAGAVYRTMPNDTDLSVFLRAKYGGLNFAFNQGWEHYHTSLDDPAHLDPRSLAHHGRIALGLARRLGQGALPEPAPDPVFFNLVPGVLIVYSEPIARGLALVLTFALVVACATYRGRYFDLARAFGFALTGIALAVLWSVGLALAARWFHGSILGVGDALRSRWYHLAVIAGSVALALRASILEDAGARATRAVVALALWTGLAVLTAAKFPPASYLFAWPALGGLLGLVRTASGITRPAWLGGLFGTLFPAAAMIMLGSTVTLFFESLGNDPAAAGITGFLLGLTVPLVVALGELEAPSRLGTCLLPLALVAVAAAGALTRPSPAHPDQVWLAYALDGNSGDARWIGLPQKPTPWAAAKLGERPETGMRPDLLITRARAVVAHAPAPRATLAAPEVKTLEERTAGSSRVVKLRVTSPRGATQFWVALPAPRIQAARFAGRDLPPPGRKQWGDMPGRFDRRRADPAVDYTLEACGVPPEGFELALTLSDTGPLTLRVADFSYSLPPSVAGERPPDTLAPWDFGLCTVVTKTVVR